MSQANTYQTIFTHSELLASWRELFGSARPKAKNTVGIDNLSLNDFARDPKGEVRLLAKDLKTMDYSFSPLRAHLIPKTTDKYRLICVPTVRDRIVQRTLLRFLSKKYHKQLANKISYGFVQGRTVQQAAATACHLRASHRWVLKTDICSFFDQIDRNLLAQAVTRLVRAPSLHGILLSAIACEIGPVSRTNKTRISKMGIQTGLGVRQGMPLSPFFSNVILLPFDREIERRRLCAVRYADDLIFFADSQEACENILEQCKQILLNLKLTLPGLEENTKTIIYAPNQPAEFLGLGICETDSKFSLTLLPEQRKKIRKTILDLGSVKELLSRRITLANLGRAIENRISGYVAAYDCCDNLNSLERELDALGKKVRRIIYSDELKIPLALLSPDARAFLDL